MPQKTTGAPGPPGLAVAGGGGRVEVWEGQTSCQITIKLSEGNWVVYIGVILGDNGRLTRELS